MDGDLMKASTRSQLEAARARFFAELMQSSDLFKDSPRHSFALGSESGDIDRESNNNELDNKPAGVGKSPSLSSLTKLT